MTTLQRLIKGIAVKALGLCTCCGSGGFLCCLLHMGLCYGCLVWRILCLVVDSGFAQARRGVREAYAFRFLRP